MTDFKILTYIRKWYIPIMIFSLLCCYFFSEYIQDQQTYTASVVISYVNSRASEGLTPTGEEIDVTQITAANVISDAINELDLDLSIDFVRSRISVEPIVSAEESARKEAILANGEEYTFYPTDYLVSFGVGSSYSAEFARRVLESVIRMYIRYYGEKYVDLTIKPDNIANTNNQNYDYLERVEMIEDGLDDIIDYLKMRRGSYPYFYCSSVGYSFGNMLDLYSELRELKVYKLYARILNDCITQDQALLVEKYKYRLDNAQIQKTTYEEKLASLEPIINRYKEDTTPTDVLDPSQPEDNAPAASITDDAPIYSGIVNNSANQQTTYDALLNNYVSYKTKLGNCVQDIDYCNEIIEIFSAASDPDKNTPEMQREADAELRSLTRTTNELYATLRTLISEFNEYNSTRNITTRSTINVSRGINTTLYITVALVFFLIVGCVGSIVIGRMSEIAKYHLYVDPKTDLPNRVSCDNEIDRLARKPLGNDVVCISLQLTTLAEVNEHMGRKQGDILLRNFGIILKHCGAYYGFVGYNGGPNFLCLFEKCRYEKALDFEQQLTKTLKNYNEQYVNNPIKVRYAICESEREGLYSIRDLLKKSMSKLYAK